MVGVALSLDDGWKDSVVAEIPTRCSLLSISSSILGAKIFNTLPSVKT